MIGEWRADMRSTRYAALVLIAVGLLAASGEARTPAFTVTLVDGWSPTCDNVWKVYDMGPMGVLDALGGTIVMDASPDQYVSAAIYVLTGQLTDPTTVIAEGHYYATAGQRRAQFTVSLPAGTYVRVPGRLYLGAACGGSLSLYATMLWTPPQ